MTAEMSFVFNDDEQVFPSWLNDGFFLSMVRQFTKDDTVVLTESVTLRPGTAKGDHYGSVMYRTTVHYRSKRDEEITSLKLIMKLMPLEDGLKKEMLESSGVFEKEYRMYEHVLPEMARLLEGIGERFVYPKYFYGTMKPHGIIVLEDVSDAGWEMRELIDTFEEAIPTVKEIAKFHAASVVLDKESGGSIQRNFGIDIDLVINSCGSMVDRGFNELIEYLKQSEELVHFVEPMQSLKTTLKEKYGQANAPSESFMNVLMHGDFTGRNLLHQFDDQQRIKDTMLIDFQLCSWTSPIVDLYYLLDLITAHPTKEKHREELIYLYHTELCGYLQKLGYLGKMPTLLDLQIELLRGALIELLHYVVFYPLRYFNPNEVDFAALLAGTVPNPALRNPEFQRIIKMELTRFLHQGTI